MSLRYSLTKTDQGIYQFKTDSDLEYSVFFTFYYLTDADGNEHLAYSFGFDRAGIFENDKFQYEYDPKIRNTVIHIIKEFFSKNVDSGLLYFCYQKDDFSRHRSITFRKWWKQETESGITFQPTSVNYNDKVSHGGILVLTTNPLAQLLIDAFTKHIEETLG